MGGTFGITLLAQAKINLTLEVLRRREDGFHEIRSVMQRITLADELRIEPHAELRLTCNRLELEGTDNLVWRAAELLRVESGCTSGAALRLTKRVPIAAGLGGGSSDAATALVGLNDFWRLGLRRERLRELAVELGSDVPFFLADGPVALAEGRGERLRLLPAFAALPEMYVVLVKPDVGISAGAVYRVFPREAWTDGSRTARWIEASLRSRQVAAPFNALEPIALSIAPEAGRARDALLEAGAAHPVMAGSGSTYFSLFDDPDDAEATAQRVRGAGWREVYVARLATK
jgi:4-diphosphocytidyl-2-C-methyl-D-erythritol kinase